MQIANFGLFLTAFNWDRVEKMWVDTGISECKKMGSSIVLESNLRKKVLLLSENQRGEHCI